MAKRSYRGSENRGGVSQPQELPAPPEGEIPRRSDPTQSYDCNESRSLYSSEHLNSRAPEASAAHCFLQIRHKTQKPAKMSAACGPRCQIKLSVDWKVADETFPKEKKSSAAVCSCFDPSVRPRLVRFFCFLSWSRLGCRPTERIQSDKGESDIIF